MTETESQAAQPQPEPGAQGANDPNLQGVGVAATAAPPQEERRMPPATLGRIVHYLGQEGDLGLQVGHPYAAVITDVHDAVTVDLTVFGHAGILHSKQSVCSKVGTGSGRHGCSR